MYSFLMLEVTKMSDFNHLYHFVSGLLLWAQAELHRCNVKSLPEGLEVTNTLIESPKALEPALSS